MRQAIHASERRSEPQKSFTASDVTKQTKNVCTFFSNDNNRSNEILAAFYFYLAQNIANCSKMISNRLLLAHTRIGIAPHKKTKFQFFSSQKKARGGSESVTFTSSRLNIKMHLPSLSYKYFFKHHHTSLQLPSFSLFSPARSLHGLPAEAVFT